MSDDTVERAQSATRIFRQIQALARSEPQGCIATRPALDLRLGLTWPGTRTGVSRAMLNRRHYTPLMTRPGHPSLGLSFVSAISDHRSSR